MPLNGAPVADKDNDPTYADDSGKAISSSWIRRGLQTLANAAGFFFTQNAASGGLGFPTWLGGFQLRWGTIAEHGAVNFASAFPGQCLGVLVGSEAGSGVHVRVHVVHGTITAAGFTYDTENVNNSAGRYFAWGV